jgi:hypothetical protein
MRAHDALKPHPTPGSKPFCPIARRKLVLEHSSKDLEMELDGIKEQGRGSVSGTESFHQQRPL